MGTSPNPPQLSQPDEFPLDPSAPDYQLQLLINEFHATIPGPRFARFVKPAQTPGGRKILDLPDQYLAIEAVLARRIWQEWSFEKKGSMEVTVCEFRDMLANLSSLLYRRNPCAFPDQAAELINRVADLIKKTGTRNFERDFQSLVRIAGKFKEAGNLSDGLREALETLKEALSHPDDFDDAARRRTKQTIDQLLVQ